MQPYFYYQLQQSDFSIQSLDQKLQKQCPKSGAIVTFSGLVRDGLLGANQAEHITANTKENQVRSIELSCYKSLCEKQIKSIGEQAFEKFELDGLVVIHRYGDLKVQQQIVFVGVASKHRKDAFLAAEMTMDFLKSKVAFWKKEHYTNGQKSKWIEPVSDDYVSLNKWQ